MDSNKLTWTDPKTDTVKTKPIDPNLSWIERRILEKAAVRDGIETDAWYDQDRDIIMIKVRVFLEDPPNRSKAGIILELPIKNLYVTAEGLEYAHKKVK